MSEQINPLVAMLEQYEQNNKPRYEKKENKVYDLKNYFTTFLPVGVDSATKTIRILPNPSGTPFTQVHVHTTYIDNKSTKYACLKHEKGEACPFCEAREVLLSTGNEADKELAKKYSAKQVYVVKIIDRDKESEGVKFWRFNHDYTKNGVIDKILGMVKALKKDITHPETGRDLIITINRNQKGNPTVTSVASLDPSPLSEDAALTQAWLADTRTWEDVYSIKSYDYLEIIVKGGVPVWDKEAKTFVDKTSVAEKTETENLDTELTLGVENVKASIVAAYEPEESEEVDAGAGAGDDESDDLPF